jgi:integrase
MSSKRRGAGEGSIYQRKDGLWVGAISCGWDLDGRQRQTVSGRTRQMVAQKLEDARRRAQTGEAPIDERATVAQYLQRWLLSVGPRVRPRTATFYALIVRTRLIPNIGRVKLSRLTPLDVEAMLASVQQAGLSPQTTAHCRAVLRCALTDAVRSGLVPRNVVTLTDAPRVATPAPAVLTPEQVGDVLDALSDPSLRRLATVAVHSGLRQGELLGLRWADVDLEQRQVRVLHALQRAAGHYALVEPKSASSRRVVALTPAAVEALREERRAQREAQLRAKRWRPPISDLVFTTSTGQPRSGTAITHAFADALRAAGLSPLRWHDLRAAHGGLLLAAGVDIAVISKMLGHSSVALTVRHYAGVGEALGRQASERFAALFEPASVGTF